MLDLLHKTGYSSEDVVELCSIYQQQLQNLLTQAKLYSVEELSSEIHKLKGGASLLMMKDSLELIAIIEEMQKNNEHKIECIENTVNTILVAVSELKAAAINSDKKLLS